MANFRTLDLNLLRVFDSVMTEGSLTRAAQVLAMTQPAVSHAVRRLRLALGEALFTRTAAGVRPTPHAQALWPHVREALATLEAVLAPTAYDPRRDAVAYRVAMADATAATLMPGVVAAIERAGSIANVRVLPLATRDPRRLLERDEADLAVGYFPDLVPALATQGREAALRHARLYASEYVCVMRKRHPLAAAPLTLEAYCEAHHLLVSFSGRPQGLVDQALASLGRQRRIVLTVNQFFTAGRVVTRSDLLTVLPDNFVPATGFTSQLVVRSLPFTLARPHVEMVWPVRLDRSPAQAWLRAALQEAAAAAA